MPGVKGWAQEPSSGSGVSALHGNGGPAGPESARITPYPRTCVGLSVCIGSAVTIITNTITVAAGVFAPGHLGELTQIVPFELADAVLAETGAVQRRLRVLMTLRETGHGS